MPVINHPARVAAVVAAIATGMFASPARAECFLKLENAKGESTDARHRDEIEITGFNWGLTQSASSHVSAGAGSGSADFWDVKLSKSTDRATPVLAQFAARGLAIKSAVLSCRANAKSADYLTITLESVFVSSFKITVERDRPVEEFALNFGKITMEQQQIKPDGSRGATTTFTFTVAKAH